MAKELTGKQRSAIDAYFETQNKTEAWNQVYNVAGNSNRETCAKRAQELFNLPMVKAEVNRIQGELTMNKDFSRAIIVKRLSSILDDYERYKVMAEGIDPSDPDQREHVKILASLAKASDALNAIKQICKLMGLDAPEKVDVNHTVTINITKPTETD